MAEVALEAEQTVYPHSSQPSLGKPINFDSTLVAEVDEAQAQENTYTSKTNASVPSPLIPNIGMSPISSVSQELAHFSEYVTAAAVDVERTEYLVVTLQETIGQIENLSYLITAVRDQTNLLVFHNSTQDQMANGSENLIPFNEQGRPNIDKGADNQRIIQPFDAIRDATERAEKTLQLIRISMQTVTSTANEIATTASNQALEATNKLLLQSEYLQSLLDDIITKMSPSHSAHAASSNDIEDEERLPQHPFEHNPNRKL
jgi:methyl-accepting chemotaxis protein